MVKSEVYRLNLVRKLVHFCGDERGAGDDATAAAASCVAIGHNFCTAAQDLGPPFGSTAGCAATFFDRHFKFVYAGLHQCLTQHSIIDDQILTVATKLAIVFPPRRPLFRRIDGVLHHAEALPEKKIDEFMRNLIDGILSRLGFLSMGKKPE
ncbi:hypothetical protein M569_02610 [Genlisea aurea]|uniref:Uncharacterized protein n=1 Tax=Genlisea aurea TaxID=192259 RepID=S8CYU1_9LAMI|nr:hypothetical protein M569_02610 [Genlisea aurea]